MAKGGMKMTTKVASRTFYSPGLGKQVKCPVDGCEHVGDGITKVHLRMAHGMTRDDVIKRFGYPTIVETKGTLVSENNSRVWNSVSGANKFLA